MGWKDAPRILIYLVVLVTYNRIWLPTMVINQLRSEYLLVERLSKVLLFD